ncbi:MAG: NAD(P)-binding protein [Oscillatoriaceae cyanobacterium]
MTEPSKKKIAILGGGMGSMVTAFELTSQPNWQDLYDITVYQVGWRLGGKGASGRNMTAHQSYEPDYRVQEHGFHIFFGFYGNTFRLMKECYDALENEPGIFPGIENAFQPHSFIVFEDQDKHGQWVPWNLHFPYFKNQYPWPDNDVEVGSLWEYISKTLEFMLQKHSESSVLESVSEEMRKVAAAVEPMHPDLLARLGRGLEMVGEEGISSWEKLTLKSDRDVLKLAYKFAVSVAQNMEKTGGMAEGDRSTHNHEALLGLLDYFMKLARHKFEDAIQNLEGKLEGAFLDALRILIICNLGYAIIRGILVNAIFNWQSFNDLDQQDFRNWIADNGGWDETVNSVLVEVMYDLLLAFPGGVATRDNGQLGAAATVRWIWRMIFTYKGAIMWKMNAGMGDTIFTPFYTELKKRGVKFEFFHRVTNLSLNPEKNGIATIEMGRQVTLKNPDAGYQPLITVKDLLCWPSDPLYEQIVEGEQLQAQEIDLESFWTPWQDVETITLNYGQDFDLVVLGISIGAFPFICKELIDAKIEWQQMVKYVQTVTTQGGQLWLKPTLQGLGWNQDSPVLGTYVEPLDTYADLTHLIERENWPVNNAPQNIAYFTGVMEDPGIPDASNHDFPAQQQQKINQRAIDWLNSNTGGLWPKATTQDNPNGLDWNLLVDLEEEQGEQRFYSQFWRINITPSERYVLSVPQSYQFRLRPDTSRWDDRPRGFQNLYLTGDWVDNSFNSGCIEATTMAGMQAARVLLQQQFGLQYHRQQIIGEYDAWPKPQ